MTDAATFWNKIAPKYAKSPIRDTASYEYTTDRTRSYLSATHRVLEIGCGTGSTALLLAPQVVTYTGTDLAPAMVQIANDKAQDVANLRFDVATAHQAAQRAADFDVVLGFNIFHLTDNFDDILATLAAKMTPGALFISKTPCLAEPSIGLKRFAFRLMIPVMQLVGVAPVVRMLTNAEAEGKIQAAGFDLIETGSFPQMSRYIVARRRG